MPGDAKTAASIAWLLDLRTSERNRLDLFPALITDDMMLGRRFLKEPEALDLSDARYSSFRDGNTMAEGSLEKEVNVWQLAISTFVMAAVFALTLFLPAGTLAWAAGWAYFVLALGFTIALSIWLLQFNPDLLAERMTGIGKPDQKSWDKVFLAMTALVFFAWHVVMALDAVRFRWTQMPLWLQRIGACLLLGSFYIFYLTFRENSYLSPAVRVQSERGQTVVSTGPYKYVRHPLYSGFVLYAVGTALLLGSGYGLIGALLLIAMIAWRAVREERVLQEELKGYDNYLSRVRYRLIPYLW
jgi:protein-S-isoprenylcysteine O-methyltransferase Ste14